MSSLPATMRAGVRHSNSGADGIEDFRRDRHGLPINAVPVTQTAHLSPANAAALQYQVRAGDAATPLLYHSALQGFPGSQLIGQATASTSNSSPNQEAIERFPFQYSTGSVSTDSNDSTPASQSGVKSTTTTTTTPIIESDVIMSVPVSATAGQFYVMMSPQEVLQGQRTLAQFQVAKAEPLGRSSRDERRRATHNEVERRRRDKINNWIVTLSKLVPDCIVDAQNSKSGVGQSLSTQSKGGILAKTVEHITELKMTNARLAEQVKENPNVSLDVEMLRQQLDELKAENAMLRNTLAQHGISMDPS